MGIFKILKESITSSKKKGKAVREPVEEVTYHTGDIAESIARNSVRINRVKERLKLLGLNDEIFHDYIVAAYTLSLAISWCDKELHYNEEKEIKDFINDISSSRLPKEIKQKIKDISEYFHDLEDKSQTNLLKIAFEEIDKYSKKHNIPLDELNDFDDIIIMIINSDGHLRHNEKSFYSMWLKKKESIYDNKN